MGLAWQQGPLATASAGRFLVPGPLPERLLYAEPLRRRMRVRLGPAWVADSEDIVVLHEPGRYPVAYFPLGDITDGALEAIQHTTNHRELGRTAWYSVSAGGLSKQRAAWQHTELPSYASELKGRAAFAWRAMDAFYEEDERIVGHAADAYHRIDIRQTSRHMVVSNGDRAVADTTSPVALYESGFAPRWYIPREDVDESALTLTGHQTFCPYKGLCSYYDVTPGDRAAWSYQDAWHGVRRVSGMISFEPDQIEVYRDGVRQHLEPGQTVVPHGIDRDLTLDEMPAGSHP